MTHYKTTVLSDTGRFGPYGGCYVPEVLWPTMQELAAGFAEAITDDEFLRELAHHRTHFCGRPTPLTYCQRLTEDIGGAKLYIKHEGLNHTGAHKMNHCLGQILLAKRLGKKRIIAETGAGQHGYATATVAAKFGLACTVYMGAKDYARQRPNVYWMERLGAEVVPVQTGDQTLRDAVNAAMQDLITHPADTHYLLGTVCGPHPYPRMNAYFQKVIGEEVRWQLAEYGEGLPNVLTACCGGGSNALGVMYEFLDEPTVELVAVEAGGRGITETATKADHAARFQTGSVGVVEGFKSYFLQSPDGQVKGSHSISAGLDYSGVGPQVAYLYDEQRLQAAYATDDEVLVAYERLARLEGMIGAMESCHGLVEAVKQCAARPAHEVVVCHLSGRGEKDLFITARHFDRENFQKFVTDWSHDQQ